MKVTISIMGEGKRDFGSENFEDRGDIDLFLEIILQHCLKREPRYDVETVSVRYHPKEKKEIRTMGQRVKEAIRQSSFKSQPLVIVLDDRKEDRGDKKEILKRYRDEAFQAGHKTTVVIGVAIKEIEAWMLADESARVCGFDKIGRKTLSNNPEDIDDPKSELAQFYGEYVALLKSMEHPGKIPSLVECRKSIIMGISVEKLCKLCPKGFEPFFHEVKEHLQPFFE